MFQMKRHEPRAGCRYGVAKGSKGEKMNIKLNHKKYPLHEGLILVEVERGTDCDTAGFDVDYLRKNNGKLQPFRYYWHNIKDFAYIEKGKNDKKK